MRNVGKKSTASALFLFGVRLFNAITLGDALTYPEYEAAQQPKTVHTIGTENTYAYGSLSMETSPWCVGYPTSETYWVLKGMNAPTADAPFCKNSQGEWEQNPAFVLPTTDLNGYGINRKDCAALDVNADATLDIVCVSGFNTLSYSKPEVFVTNPETGVPVLSSGYTGLTNAYDEMDSQYINVLSNTYDGSNMVLITTTGESRLGFGPNQHRMFKLSGSDFVEVPGPWAYHFGITSKPIIADINGDGLDDIIVWRYQETRMFTAKMDGTFDEVKLPTSGVVAELSHNWMAARVADITGDGLQDLVVNHAYGGLRHIHVFEGISGDPYFNFRRPVYSNMIANVAYDIELLDTNGDGLLDIYVLQHNDVTDGCVSDSNASYVPPDNERDVMFIGNGMVNGKPTFTKIKTDFKGRGCSGFLHAVGPKKLVVGGGYYSYVGQNTLMEW